MLVSGHCNYYGFPRDAAVKNPPVDAGDEGDDKGLIPGQGRLEEEIATHFSILAWKIQWTEEPGRLLSIGSQRVRHD